MTTKKENGVSDAWSMQLPKWQKGDMKKRLAEESSYSVMFPKYREKYIQEAFPILQKKMEQDHGLKVTLDLVEGVLEVSTTRNTWDPYIILKGRDVIKLLSRSVPAEQAIRVLEDDTTCEIIKIRNMVGKKEVFVNRRQRLIGANGTTLKAIELLTDCYVLVQGHTVAVIGPYKGVLEVMNLVENTLKNVHPVYLLKTLMIKRQLMSDPKLANEDWSRFLPKFKKNNIQRQKPKKIRVKKPYTPFPPAQLERKIDKEMAEGKYFIDSNNQWKKKVEKKGRPDAEKKKEVAQKQKEKRERPFIPPQEPDYKPSSSSGPSSDVDVEALKKKVKKIKK